MSYHSQRKVAVFSCGQYETFTQLVNTDKSIIDIALESGFNSQSYFTQLYRKRFNQTPSHSRQATDEQKITVSNENPLNNRTDLPYFPMTA
uniref:helix-turn-helix domain-containing protein n=1 Tax=Endozoicomonas sp. Mp262 TaxID=2919499 RepID=UPI00351B7704